MKDFEPLMKVLHATPDPTNISPPFFGYAENAFEVSPEDQKTEEQKNTTPFSVARDSIQSQ